MSQSPLPTFGSSHTLRELGSGGQGRVYVVRRHEREHAREKAVRDLGNALRTLTAVGSDWRALADSLRSLLDDVLSPDVPKDLGAAKQFKIPDGDVGAAAIKRFEREIEVLKAVQHPNILCLLDFDLANRWMISETHESPLAKTLFVRRERRADRGVGRLGILGQVEADNVHGLFARVITHDSSLLAVATT